MRELQQKQKLKQRLYSTPLLLVMLVVTFLISNGAYGVMKKRQESTQSVTELEAKVSSLTLRQTELKANIDRLQTEEGIDTEIKKKFSVSKAGEHVVVIVDPHKVSTTTSTTTASWYKKFSNLIQSLW